MEAMTSLRSPNGRGVHVAVRGRWVPFFARSDSSSSAPGRKRKASWWMAEPSLWARTRQATGELGQNLLSVAQAVQDSTTRRCIVCQQSMLRTIAVDCTVCEQPCCRNCRVVVTALIAANGASTEAAQRQQFWACRGCEPAAQERHRAANVQIRMMRVEAFLQGRLEPFQYSPESKLEKTLRLGGHAMYGLNQVAALLPIGPAANTIRAGYYLVRYGPLILAGNDILEAFQLIFGLAKTIDADRAKIASKEFFGGLYYMMGEHWGERSKAPELEFHEHVGEDGRVPHPGQELLLKLRRLLQLLHVAKEGNATDAQRLLRYAMPGGELVLAEFCSNDTERARLLACMRRERAAYLILPGTSNPADYTVDFNVEAEPLAGGNAHRGMARSAQWLLGEVGPLLLHLYAQGYSITVVGHSLGAGVGALLTALLRPHISTISCYGFGTPACVDESLLPAFLDCMVSVVNRDDMVPRLSVRSVQTLAHSVLCPGQTAKTEAWMAEDMQALKDLERLVELRRRTAPAAIPGSQERPGGQVENTTLAMLLDAGVGREAAAEALRLEDGDASRALLRATEIEAERLAAQAELDKPVAEAFVASAPPIASTNQEPPVASAPPIASTNQEPPVASAPPTASSNQEPLVGPSGAAFLQGFWRSASDVATGYVQAFAGPLRPDGAGDAPSASSAGPAPANRHNRFLVPGQIVHLYKQNGLSRAALAEPTHDSFTHIAVCKDMLNDHHLASYAEAIQQALIPEPATPRWEPFEERSKCACCDADFNWAFVLHSEPQRMLARHHCYSCGRGVCDGCSDRQLAHPHLGFLSPVRTCDRCFYSHRASVPAT